MAQFVLKIEKLSHIMGPRASQDLRSPSLIMAPDFKYSPAHRSFPASLSVQMKEKTDLKYITKVLNLFQLEVPVRHS